MYVCMYVCMYVRKRYSKYRKNLYKCLGRLFYMTAPLNRAVFSPQDFELLNCTYLVLTTVLLSGCKGCFFGYNNPRSGNLFRH